jgi:hypothetical protein
LILKEILCRSVAKTEKWTTLVHFSDDFVSFDIHYLYVASESGPVSVFRVAAAVTKIGDIRVGPNAHVVVVDPATHRAYFPLKNLDGRTTLRIFEPRQ